MSGATEQQVRDYFREKSWSYKEKRESSGLHLIADCPFCGKAGHFYVNVEKNGVWDCKVCGKSGGFYALRQELGDVSAVQHFSHAAPGAREAPLARQGTPLPTMQDVSRAESALFAKEPLAEAALAYLTQTRKIPVEILREASVGLWARWGKTLIGIPYIVPTSEKAAETERCANVKFRTVPPAAKGYMRWEGGESRLYGEETLRGQETVMLVEGELDVLAARAYGFHAVGSTSLGARGWNADWKSILDGAKKILLAYDQDEEGEAGAKALSERLGKTRCLRVRLPHKDLGECLEHGVQIKQMRECLTRAHPMINARIEHVSGIAGDLLTSGPDEVGKPTPFASLTNLVGGVRPGDLWVITGETGHGKSTFCVNLTYRLGLEGVPSLMFPSEQRPVDWLRKMGASALGGSWYTATLADKELAVRGLSELPLYVLCHYGKIKPDDLRDAIRVGVQSFGCQTVLLDHLHFFWPSRGGEYETTDIGSAIEELKEWAQQEGVCVILVVQPRQGQGSARVTMSDLRGSAKLKQTADVIIVVEKRKTDLTSSLDEAILHVEKVRFDGGSTGKVPLRFWRGSQSFTEPPPDSVQRDNDGPEAPDPDDNPFGGGRY